MFGGNGEMGEGSLISVVVPAWRAEKTLAAALD